jgi:U4/U6 small nuclear ribonucleoprotein PRP4
VKVWSGRSFECIKTLAGHEGKVMAVDVAPDGSNMLASVSYDRSLKLWAPDSI